MRLNAVSLSHVYGGLQALDDVSFDLDDGETLAIVGPSGCGKSTLLGIAGGLIQPTAGQVTTVGVAPADCLCPIAYVFQDFALLPWRSVADNVALALEHHRLTAADRAGRVRTVLEICGLDGFAEALPKQLSGGMRQRVGVARALVVRPAILLLDEPLSALDAQTADLLLADLLSLGRTRAMTQVHVTHNLNEALRVADRVLVLSRRPGRVKALIPVEIPKDARTEPGHAARLTEYREALWQLIRDEARDAEREVAA